MSGVQHRQVGTDEDGMRLDRWFRLHFPDLRHGMLEKYLRKGHIRVNGGRVKSASRLSAGQQVRVPPLGDHSSVNDQPSSSHGRRETAPISAQQHERNLSELRQMVVFEDTDLLVLNKPHGLAVQGGTNTRHHVDGMLASWGHESASEDARPRLVHRLDRDTAGILILAKTRDAATKLGAAFQQHRIDKTYWALTVKTPNPREGRIKLPIAKRMVRVGDDEMERMIPAEGEDAKQAYTDFQTIDDANGGVAFVVLRPLTGRTHQLRVHCAAMGTPIVGDGKYGGPESKIDGLSAKLHLFCRSMRIAHPRTGAMITFTAPPSGHIRESWKFFGFEQDVSVAWPDDQ